MKKTLSFVFISLMITSSLFTQNYVSPEPGDKNVILEEFTGVKCPNCPAGHQTAASILANNPGRAFVIAYHPFNSNYTTPYAGEPDFRRSFADALYQTPYCGTSRFMPSAFINREKWANNERIQSRTSWVAYADQIIAQASPVNVGISSTYDNGFGQLIITVEVYFTSDVTETVSLNVALLENGLISTQSGGGSNYEHKHTFREAFTDQWGDIISNPTTTGSYLIFNYTFDNNTQNYNMEKCDVVASIYDMDNGSVISGIGAEVGHGSFVAPIPEFTTDDTLVNIGQSVSFSNQSICMPTSWNWTFEGGTPETSTEENPVVTYNEGGQFSVTLVVENEAGSNTITKENYINVWWVGIEEEVDNNFEIYPNPTNGIFKIANKNIQNIISVEVYNTIGQMVTFMDADIQEGDIEIDLQGHQKGVYYIMIKTTSRNFSKRLLLID